MYSLTRARTPASIGFVIVLLVVLSGCASTGGMKAVEGSVTASADQATVVFMRSSFYGSAVSASVFDVTGEETEFIGVVKNGTKVAYQVPPGDHTFMVISEAADFMKATLRPGRIYYALVTPRMGAWRARFSFRPLRAEDLDGEDFDKWNRNTDRVEPADAAYGWARANASDIEDKRARYWPEWQSKEQHQRESQTLNPEDGR